MKRVLAAAFVASSIVSLLVACAPDDGEHGWAHGGRDEGGNGVRLACEAYTTCGTCTPIVGCGWCEGDDGVGRCAPGPDRCTGDSFRWTWEPKGCGLGRDAGASSDAATSGETSSTGADAGVSDAAVNDAATSDAASADAVAADTTATDAITSDGSASDAPAADAGSADAPSDDASTSDAPAADGSSSDAPSSDVAASDGSISPSCGPASAPSGCVVTSGGSLCSGAAYTLGCHAPGAAPGASLRCTQAAATSGGTYYCCPCN